MIPADFPDQGSLEKGILFRQKANIESTLKNREE
jgi:hypothetical protein